MLDVPATRPEMIEGPVPLGKVLTVQMINVMSWKSTPFHR